MFSLESLVMPRTRQMPPLAPPIYMGRPSLTVSTRSWRSSRPQERMAWVSY